MIRVLHYIGSLEFGGSQSFVMEMYRQIDRHEIQFDFVVSPGTPKDFSGEAIAMGARIFECPRFDGKNLRYFRRWWFNFIKEHPEYKILHGHVRSTAAIYAPIAKKLGLTVIIHSHSTSNGHGIVAHIKDVLQLPVRYIADYCLACSDEAGKWLFGKKILKSAKYMMVPNGIDVRRFQFNSSLREEIRSQLNLSDQDFVVGHVGRFHEAKNHKFLISFFEQLLEKRPNSKLILVGDGNLKDSISEQISRLNLTDKVRMVGAVANPDVYYQAMDVFVFPSIWEGLPVSVIEAQANRLPCLISNTITEQVNLTSYVHEKSLTSPISNWVNTIDQFHIRSKSIEKMGVVLGLEKFDSREVSRKLSQLYTEIVAEQGK